MGVRGSRECEDKGVGVRGGDKGRRGGGVRRSRGRADLSSLTQSHSF